MKKIAIAGYSCTELPIFLATMLGRLNKNTFIYDASKTAENEPELISLTEDRNENGVLPPDSSKNGFTIVTDVTSVSSDADVAIEYYGEQVKNPNITEADIIIMGTDMYSRHAEALKNIKIASEEPVNAEDALKAMDDAAEQASDETPQEETPADAKKKKKDKKKGKNEKSPEELEHRPILFINDYIGIHKYDQKYLSLLADKQGIETFVHLLNNSDLAVRYTIGYERLGINNLSAEYKRILETFVSMIIGEELTKAQLKSLYEKR